MKKLSELLTMKLKLNPKEDNKRINFHQVDKKAEILAQEFCWEETIIVDWIGQDKARVELVLVEEAQADVNQNKTHSTKKTSRIKQKRSARFQLQMNKEWYRNKKYHQTKSFLLKILTMINFPWKRKTVSISSTNKMNKYQAFTPTQYSEPAINKRKDQSNLTTRLVRSTIQDKLLMLGIENNKLLNLSPKISKLCLLLVTTIKNLKRNRKHKILRLSRKDHFKMTRDLLIEVKVLSSKRSFKKIISTWIKMTSN